MKTAELIKLKAGLITAAKLTYIELVKELTDLVEACHNQKLEILIDDINDKLQELFGTIDDEKSGYWINGDAQKKILDFNEWLKSLLTNEE